MSINRYDKTHDQLIKLAGNTIILDATASEIREGTFSIQCVGNSGANTSITFETPMPDTDYVVIFESNSPAAGEIGFRSKTTTGFDLYVLGGRGDTEVYTFTGQYYAFRLVKLEGYTALQNKVSNPDSTPTNNSTNLVTSGGVYDAIKNRGISERYYLGTGVYDRPYLQRTITINKTGHNVMIVTVHMGSDTGYQSNYASVAFDIPGQLYEAGTELRAIFPGYNETTQTISWDLVHFANVTAVTQDTITLSTEGITSGYPWFHIHVI